MKAAHGHAWQAAAPWSGETLHAATFYAHPVACAAALAALDVIDDEGLIERCATLGARLHEGLAQIALAYPDLVREVRGKGMLAALVVATPELALAVTRDCLAAGLIVLPGAMEGDAISLSPPWTIDERQLAWGLSVLDHALHARAGHDSGGGQAG
jgi:4-aminobutyrate aminotransferase-like enzyme